MLSGGCRVNSLRYLQQQCRHVVVQHRLINKADHAVVCTLFYFTSSLYVYDVARYFSHAIGE